MASSINFLKKTLVVITGASQGIGRCLAVEVGRRLIDGSIIIAIARSENNLADTKRLILEQNKNLSVQIHSLDLTNPDKTSYDNIFEKNFDVEQALIFHNVGQVGILNQTTALTNIQSWRDYFDLNVFSVGILNSILFHKLHNKVKHLMVINITSMCGRQPIHNLAMYGSGKAARELYFKVFALEQPDVTVLSYSPGPVDTEMVQEIVENAKSDALKDIFVNLKEQKTILTAKQTVEKLLGILEKGKFKSGDVIDYYDRT